MKTVYPPTNTVCGGYNEGARVFKTLNINFSDAQGQITKESVMVFSGNLNSFKLSSMSMLPARMKVIQSNMKALQWSQHFSHYKSMGIFSRCSRAANSLVRSSRNFEIVRDAINVLVTCKNEKRQ